MNNVPAKDLPQCLSFTKIDIKTDPPGNISSQLYGNSSGYFTDLVKNGYGQMQEQSHWCWVACAASVGSFYMNKEFGRRQEAIYETAKDLPSGACNCPPRSYSNEDTRCNGTGWPNKALSVINAFSREVSGRASRNVGKQTNCDGRQVLVWTRCGWGIRSCRRDLRCVQRG